MSNLQEKCYLHVPVDEGDDQFIITGKLLFFIIIFLINFKFLKSSYSDVEWRKVR